MFIFNCGCPGLDGVIWGEDCERLRNHRHSFFFHRFKVGQATRHSLKIPRIHPGDVFFFHLLIELKYAEG